MNRVDDRQKATSENHTGADDSENEMEKTRNKDNKTKTCTSGAYHDR